MKSVFKRCLAAGAAALTLALAGCGAAPKADDGPAPEKSHYYQILDAAGEELYTVTAEDAVEEIDALVRDADEKDEWTGDMEDGPLYTYVFWQEDTLLAGEDPDSERTYSSWLRITVRADSDVITTEVPSSAVDALAEALPQMDLGDILTFSAKAAPETAEALRAPGRFADA